MKNNNSILKILVITLSILVISGCSDKAEKIQIMKTNSENEIITNYSAKEGLVDDFISSITVEALKDREIIWIGTWKGLVKYDDDDRWITYTKKDGILQDQITDIVIDNNKKLWVSSISLKKEGGLSVFDGRTWKSYNTFGQKDEYANIVSLYVDSKNRVWTGSWGNGIAMYNNDTWKYYKESDGIPSDEIMDITEYNGNIWFATKNAGAFYLNEETNEWIVVNEHSSKIINKSICSLKSNDESLWIGTWGGVSRFQNNSWKNFTSWNGLPDNFVRTMDIDVKDKEIIYFGTDKGLSIFNGKDWIYITQKGITHKKQNSKDPVLISREDTLPSDKVICIANSQKYIWVGTDKGLSRIKKEPLDM